MKAQYITDENGKKTGVILPIATYKKLMDEIDEFECIKAYDKSKSRPQEFLPMEEVFNTIERKRKAK